MAKENQNTTKPPSEDPLDVDVGEPISQDEVIKIHLAGAKIPRRYADARWNNFKVEYQQGANTAAWTKLSIRLNAFREWRGDEIGKTLVFLTGRPGCGKTHLACATIQRWVRARNPGALFVVVGELLTELRRGFDSGTSYGEMRRARDAKLLVLDDLGSEMSTDWVRDTMYMMINYRLNHMKPTVITSNLLLGEIAETYHARLASRLAGEFAIDMNILPDHRLVNG